MFKSRQDKRILPNNGVIALFWGNLSTKARKWIREIHNKQLIRGDFEKNYEQAEKEKYSLLISVSLDYIMQQQEELENEYDDLLDDEIINANVLIELLDKYSLE